MPEAPAVLMQDTLQARRLANHTNAVRLSDQPYGGLSVLCPFEVSLAFASAKRCRARSIRAKADLCFAGLVGLRERGMAYPEAARGLRRLQKM